MIIFGGLSGTEVMITVIDDRPLFKILLRAKVILSIDEVRERQVTSETQVNN